GPAALCGPPAARARPAPRRPEGGTGDVRLRGERRSLLRGRSRTQADQVIGRVPGDGFSFRNESEPRLNKTKCGRQPASDLKAERGSSRLPTSSSSSPT